LHAYYSVFQNQALNGVRIQGVGPLIAASPTRHDAMPMVQPLDVQHFQQHPSIWASLGPADPSLESHTPAFQQLIQEFGGPGIEGVTYLNHPHHGQPYHASSMEHELDSFSPQLAGSDLSSPSCSE